MIVAARTQLTRALFVVTTFGAATTAWAQVQPPPVPQGSVPTRRPAFRPEIAVGLTSDDNLFFRPNGSSDLILRVTPSFEAHRDTPKLLVALRYRFDAEHFSDHSNLTTPMARQDGGFEATVRTSPRGTFTVRGGYQRTHTAGELNLTSGLTTQRMLASRWIGGLELTHSLGVRGSLVAVYDGSADTVELGSDATSHGVRVRFIRTTGVRDQVFAGFLSQRTDLRPGGVFYSHVGFGGWTRKVSPSTSLTLTGGARVTGDKVRPDLDAALTRQFGTRLEFGVSYARTQTVAVGIGDLLEVDRIAFRTTYREPRRWEVTLLTGAFRNVFTGNEIDAYSVSGDISRIVSRDIAVAASFNTSFNHRTVSGVGARTEEIRRNAIALSLRLARWSPR